MKLSEENSVSKNKQERQLPLLFITAELFQEISCGNVEPAITHHFFDALSSSSPPDCLCQLFLKGYCHLYFDLNQVIEKSEKSKKE